MRRLAWAVLAALVCFASPTTPDQLETPAPASSPEITLFLIGDAGAPRSPEPVLTALTREASQNPNQSVIVFLGDNVYPRGLPPPEDKERQEAQRRLDGQIQAVIASHARTIFIPGNHDWDGEGPNGWAAVRRQEEYIVARGGTRISYLPRDGCPGPEIVDDVSERLRLIILDTQWWLHTGPKPVDPTSTCAADSPKEIVEALRRALETEGDRLALIMAHHPLESGGPHGGYFDLRSHLFPLRDLHRWLWLPLPGIGSAYPLARKWGKTPQDVSGTANRRMRAALTEAFADRPPLIWASGHDHTLQVLKRKGLPLLLVSGAGIYGHTSPVRRLDSTLFSSEASGFMRLDFMSDGRIRLGVRAVDAQGTASEPYWSWVQPSSPAPPAAK